MSVLVCLSASISPKLRIQSSPKVLTEVIYGCGSVLLWRCNTLCATGLTGYFVFAHNAQEWATRKGRIFNLTHQGQHRTRGRSLISATLFLTAVVPGCARVSLPQHWQQRHCSVVHVLTPLLRGIGSVLS